MVSLNTSTLWEGWGSHTMSFHIPLSFSTSTSFIPTNFIFKYLFLLIICKKKNLFHLDIWISYPRNILRVPFILWKGSETTTAVCLGCPVQDILQPSTVYAHLFSFFIEILICFNNISNVLCEKIHICNMADDVIYVTIIPEWWSDLFQK